MLRLGLVGCGGMGCRHIGGLKKLRGIGDRLWDLVAACDVFPAGAGRAADLALESLGHRPEVFTSLETMLDRAELDAIIVTTSPDLHAPVGIAAL